MKHFINESKYFPVTLYSKQELTNLWSFSIFIRILVLKKMKKKTVKKNSEKAKQGINLD